MPAILLERLPLPSLQTYVAASVALLAVALLYTHHAVLTTPTLSMVEKEAMAAMQSPSSLQQSPAEDPGPSFFDLLRFDISPEESDPDAEAEEDLDSGNLTLPYDTYGMNFMFMLTSEAWCVWTLVNTVYCVLILLGKLIQAIVFGDLRVSEQQHLKDKFWNFVFYKFIFIFGVMNVQTMEEVVLWVAWFTCLGFLHLLTQLCKDRFEYLSFSPTTPRRAHVKLLGLLTVLLACASALLGVCIVAGFKFGLTIFAFMAAECVLLGLKALYVVVRYMIHLWDVSMEGVWENRSLYVYYSELVFELSSLSIDFAHHLHMLLWGNIFLSMASLVICMQLRYLFYEFQRRVKRHKNYLRVVKNMQARFPMATQEDLEHNADDCAICWDKMESARKLPCGHLFHNSCLRSWLEQDTSCPTCRMALTERQENANSPANNAPPGAANNANMADAAANANQGTTNHFFHFDGSRYVSWLPSFSVEVTHTSLIPGQQLRLLQAQTSQLDGMLRQVQAVFPNFPQQVILEDLRQTRSVDLTIDNILEGRLTATRISDVAPMRDDFRAVPTAPSETPVREDSPWVAPSAPPMQPPMPSPVSRTGQMAVQAAMQAAAVELSSPPLADPVLPPTQLPTSDAISTFTRQSSQTAESSPASSQSSEEQSLHGDEMLGGGSQTQGGRFSKSASERMTMLQQRKTAMLEQARRRYLSRTSGSSEGTGDGLSSASTPSSTSINTASDEERARRRELMLQATQRRLNSS
ncbi:hypothetical protein BaRGS_00008505 [Batillaria attramentaria]|uniref:Autocrine motility factor receptor n=1 Tax=Batillaria attramentaria TaxID=370345 RepID=A0ABD0LL60_9CAEN